MFKWIEENIIDPITGKTSSDAAQAQVDAIKEAQKISSEAAKKARQDALSLFAPSMDVLHQGFQQARDDLISGKESAANLFNQSFTDSANTIQSGSQQAINALLGLPSNAGMSEQAAAIESQPQITENIQNNRNPSTQIGAPRRPDVQSPQKSARRFGVQVDGMQQTDSGKDSMSPRLPGGMETVTASRKMLDRFDDPIGRPGMGVDPSPRPPTVGDVPGDIATPRDYTLPQQADPMQEIIDASNQGLTGDFVGSEMSSIQSPQFTTSGNIGLAGVESALQGSLQDQLNAMSKGTQAGLGALGAGFGTARGDVSGARSRGLAALAGAGEMARNDLSGYADVGGQALQREAALTGALGPEAQAQAFSSYNESPGQKYMREQAEKALLRNTAATGGLGGGNVLKELQEQATGLASQRYDQDLANLRSLSGRGQEAATGMSNIAQNIGAQVAGLEQATGQSLSQLAASQGMTESQLLNNLGMAQAGAIGNTGSQLAGYRQQAGRDVANTIQGATGQTAALQQGLGQALANLDLQASGNLANLSTGLAQGQSSGLQGLAALLSNLAVGQGTQQAGLAQNLGQAQAGQIGANNSFLNNAAQIIGLGASLTGGQGGGMNPMQMAGMAQMFSDERLKKNIKPLFEINGIEFVSWDWDGKLNLFGKGFGVIAQDVKDKIKDAVFMDDSGYYKVDYAKVMEFVK